MMMSVYVLLVLIVGVTMAQDQSSGAGDVKIKAMGQSGKFTLTNSATGEEIMVTPDSIKERDAAENGNEVGKSGNVKHALNSFASVTNSVDQPVPETYKNCKSKKIMSMASGLVESASVTTSIYIFEKACDFTVGTTNYSVQEGTVKFNIEIKDWTFCLPDTCKHGTKGETGKYLEYALEIKGKGKPEKKTSDSGSKTSEYDIGGGATLILAREVEIDGNWKSLPEGSPKYTDDGGKQLYTFTFPKFDSKVLYDPTINYMYQDSSASVKITSMATILICTIMAKLFM